MDHLSWHATLARPRPVVPYLCEAVENTICDEIHNLRQWPVYMRWSLFQEVPILISAQRCQAWLFFGVLRILSRIAGRQFNINNFIVVQHGCKMVDSTVIKDLMGRLPHRLFVRANKLGNKVKPSAESYRLYEELKAVIPCATEWMSWVVQNYEHQASCSDLWDFDLYNVFLSTSILLEMTCNVVTAGDPMVDQYRKGKGLASRLTDFVSSTRSLRQSLELLGHCPTIINRTNLSCLNSYRLLALPAQSHFDHTRCSGAHCMSFDIDCATYKPRHTPACTTHNCHMIEIDRSMLHRLIEQDRIPLIRSKVMKTGQLVLDIVDGTHIQNFTTISHVWAGGLGNMTDNAHYHCQLKLIHTDLARGSTLSSVISGGAVYYWLDALCIPVANARLKTQAINSMAHVYAASSSVLVIDPDLGYRNSRTMTLEEIDIAILCSPWMARSWTLQEGALAVSLIFRFSNQLLPYERLKRDTMTAQTTSIQRLWSRDVDRVSFGLEALYRLAGFNVTFHDDIPLEHRFTDIWNELAQRNTTKAEDVSAIIATFLDCSAGEVLSLTPGERVQALLRSQATLPIDILFAPQYLNTNSWSPRLPTCSQIRPSLRGTSGIMQFLPSGLFKISQLRQMHVLRAGQATALSDLQIVHNPHQGCCCYLHLDETFSSPAQMNGREVILLFGNDMVSSPAGPFGLGACFTLSQEDSDGMQLKFFASFTYKRVHCGQECSLSSSSAMNLYSNQWGEVHHISSKHPMLIDMDVQWPTLKWKRSQFYPFADASTRTAQILYVFLMITGINAFGVLALSCARAGVARLVKHGPIQPPWVSPLTGIVFIILRSSLSLAEYKYFRRLNDKTLQARWAASFWTTETDFSSTSSKLKSHLTRRSITTTLIYLTLLLGFTTGTILIFVQAYLTQEPSTVPTARKPLDLAKAGTRFILDLDAELAPYPALPFLARIACKTFFAELLLRLIVILTANPRTLFGEPRPVDSTQRHDSNSTSNSISNPNLDEVQSQPNRLVIFHLDSRYDLILYFIRTICVPFFVVVATATMLFTLWASVKLDRMGKLRLFAVVGVVGVVIFDLVVVGLVFGPELRGCLVRGLRGRKRSEGREESEVEVNRGGGGVELRTR